MRHLSLVPVIALLTFPTAKEAIHHYNQREYGHPGAILQARDITTYGCHRQSRLTIRCHETLAVSIFVSDWTDKVTVRHGHITVTEEP